MPAIGTGGGRILAPPDAPTLRELGIDAARSHRYGLFGPAGTDPAAAARPLGAVRGANALPEAQARFAEQGGAPAGGDGAALGRSLAEGVDRWAAVVRGENVTP